MRCEQNEERSDEVNEEKEAATVPHPCAARPPKRPGDGAAKGWGERAESRTRAFLYWLAEKHDLV